jgi:hypothetical protein
MSSRSPQSLKVIEHSKTNQVHVILKLTHVTYHAIRQLYSRSASYTAYSLYHIFSLNTYLLVTFVDATLHDPAQLTISPASQPNA